MLHEVIIRLIMKKIY